ncbi:MAG: hypothetical protein VX475_23710 [Myxococcota bacterium]|nr:hypothetical protein [Myxococcota bacterium]
MSMKRSFTSALIILTLAACDNKKEGVPSPDTTPRPTTTAEPKQTSATPTTPSEATSQRKIFHQGRFSIAAPGQQAKPPVITRTDAKLTTQHLWSDNSAVYALRVDESLIESPDSIVDNGMLAYAETRMLQNTKQVLEKKMIEVFGREGRYALSVSKDGKRTHQVLFVADDYTLLNLLVLERQPVTSDVVLSIVQSVKQEKAPAPRQKAKPKEISKEQIDTFMKQQAERGEVSKEDLESIPRSEKPGEPSVANSCNLITRECYETAHSAVGKGYYSNEKQCGGSFSTDPCPAQDRMGFCLLNDQQLISMYTANSATIEARKKQCEVTYSGKWLGTPKERPWPKNAAK